MNALRLIFRDQLTELAKKQNEKSSKGYNSHLGWTFVCNEYHKKPKAIRTYRTLFSASCKFNFFTPNTFYRNDCKEQASLRWINAMSIDIDVKNEYIENKGMTVPDVLNAINSAGLPTPSLVIGSPSGGFHVHWFLDKPKRAFKPVIKHYARIQRMICKGINGDDGAVGAERWFRMPKPDNIVFQSENRVSFDSLCDWFTLQVEEEKEERKEKKFVCVDSNNLLSHPAIKKILNGVEEGRRDHACYTLALAYKASGYDKSFTEAQLHNWNTKNSPAMNRIDIKRKVKSAFKSNGPAAPSSYWVRTLSGMPFTYQTWEEAKPRTERKYSHYDEWEEDVLAHIKFRGGSISGSQRNLADEIKSSVNRKQTISYATFKRVINRLVDSGQIVKLVSGKGRSQTTTLSVSAQTETITNESVASEETEKEGNTSNGLNSNTFIDMVAGGKAPSFPGVANRSSITSLTTYSSPAPIPLNVPDSFISALWTRGFTDGRFIFGAWGKVQLAFKAFGISFRNLRKSQAYLTIASEAVGITAAKKGNNLNGKFSDADSFFKYLYGTVKGLLANYRENELVCFVEEIEGLSLPELLSIGIELEEQLNKKTVVDRRLIKEKLRELELEESAVKRRDFMRNNQENNSSILFYDWINE